MLQNYKLKLEELNQTKDNIFELLKSSYITKETRDSLISDYDLMKHLIINTEIELAKQEAFRELLEKLKLRVYAWKSDISKKGINKIFKELNCSIRVACLTDEYISLMDEQIETIPVCIYFHNNFLEGCRENLKAYFEAHNCLNEQTEIIIAGLIRLFKLKVAEVREVC